MQLLEHFSLSEFERSATATKLGIANIASPQVIANLTRLCTEILEPLRVAMGVPIRISSGYRCPALNTIVGGLKNSNHLNGCAADIHLPDNATGRNWMQWIIDNCQFDECIWETADRKRYWIHVALCPDGNPQKVVSFLLKKA